MANRLGGIWGVVGAVALVIGLTAPASAEFFGCNEKTSVRTLRSANYSAPTRSYRAGSNNFTHDFSAQSTRQRYATPSRGRSQW